MKKQVFKVKTEALSNGIIEQSIIDSDIGFLGQQITKQIINTQEEQIREGLNILGWVSPSQFDRLKTAFFRHIRDDNENNRLDAFSELYDLFKELDGKTK